MPRGGIMSLGNDPVESGQRHSGEVRADADHAQDTPNPAASAVSGSRPTSRDVTAIFPELALYPDIVSALHRAYQSEVRHLDLVLTDLDNTFIPGAGRPQAEFDRGIADARRLTELLDVHNGILVCVTGSSWDVDTPTTPSVSNRVATGHIPAFLHAIVTDGGMRAYGKGGGSEYKLDPSYEASVASQKADFPAEGTFKVAEFVRDVANDESIAAELGLAPIDFAAIAQVDPSSPRSRVFFQPHVHPRGVVEGPKVSLYFYANQRLGSEERLHERDLIEKLFRRELGHHLPLICCEERDFNNKSRAMGLESATPLKFCLDITPIHKGTPVAYFSKLIQRASEVLNHQYPGRPLEIATWYCGDAANDLVGMRRGEVDSVVMVAGSSEELLRHANQLASAGKHVHVEPDQHCTGAGSILKALMKR